MSDADTQAFGILEWMMGKFPDSFPPEKIAQFEKLFAEAKKVEDSPWATDKDYLDPVIAKTVLDLKAVDFMGLSDHVRMLCMDIVRDGTLTVKQMFLVLLQYAGDHPGEYQLQGQSDKALHFICGGAIEATIGLGQAAGAFKEWTDAFDGGDVDINDYAATFAGARFVQWATSDALFLGTWADGKRTLSRCLPKLSLSETPDEKLSGSFSTALIDRITEAVNAAYANEAV